MNFFDFMNKFPTEQAVINHFVSIRYPNGISCQHCSSPRITRRKD